MNGKEHITSTDICEALRERYALPEWALMFEVANGTGSNVRRWADAVAINCFPSRGMEIHGVEIKVSKTDWQRELDQPQKSAPVQEFCDRWWVAAPVGIVDVNAVPITWGLLEYADGKLRQTRAAPALGAKPVSRTFLASILRNACKTEEATVERRISKAIEQMRVDNEERIRLEVERRSQRHRDLAKKVDEIKELTGIDLSVWTPKEDIAAAIRFAMKSGLSDRYHGLTQVHRSLIHAAEQIQEGFKAAGIPLEEKANG